MQVIDFQLERAKRKSGINDVAELRNMIDQGYDPCDSIDVDNYYEWLNFQGMISKESDEGWSDEAIQRLFDDIKNLDPDETRTVTLDYSVDELISGDDISLDYTTFSPNKT